MIILKCTVKTSGRDSSVGIATRYGLDGPGIESRWGDIFRFRPDRPWGTFSLLYNGYRVFPWGKAAGAWRWPPTLFGAEVKARVELYLYFPSGISWPVIGWPLALSLYMQCIYTGCPRRNVPNFGRVFLILNYTDITQNTYIQSWTVTEIMAREVWNFDSCYTLTDY